MVQEMTNTNFFWIKLLRVIIMIIVRLFFENFPLFFFYYTTNQNYLPSTRDSHLKVIMYYLRHLINKNFHTSAWLLERSVLLKSNKYEKREVRQYQHTSSLKSPSSLNPGISFRLSPISQISQIIFLVPSFWK